MARQSVKLYYKDAFSHVTRYMFINKFKYLYHHSSVNILYK